MTHIFFDLDGTLTKSGQGILNSIRYSLNQQQLPLPDEATLRLFIGPPLFDSYQTYLGMDKATAKNSIRLYREYYETKGIFENELYPGVLTLLSDLQTAGHQLYLATAKPEPFAHKIADYFQFSAYLTEIFGATLDGSRTQKTAVIAYGLQQLGLPKPYPVIMIGDRKDDIAGGRTFSLPTIGVLYGYGSKAELIAAKADVLVDQLAEILPQIKALTD